jgi:hypothetical protein
LFAAPKTTASIIIDIGHKRKQEILLRGPITGPLGAAPVVWRPGRAPQPDPAAPLQGTKEEIAASLSGHCREEHLFVLCQALELYGACKEMIRCCGPADRG